MDEDYNFTISESYTPRTIPMDRLAAYIAGVARLLGENASVHFDGVIEGSVAIKAQVEAPARPKVRDRVQSIRGGTAPADVRKAYTELDDMLRRDNAIGTLFEGAKNVIIAFPGKRRPEPIAFGPFRQDGTIDGQVYRIEGRDETKHIGIRDGMQDYSGLVATEALALRLRHHLFGGLLRFKGTGSWVRHDDGRWELKTFRIADFEELDDTRLDDVIIRLRAVRGHAISASPNIVDMLLADRREGGGI